MADQSGPGLSSQHDSGESNEHNASQATEEAEKIRREEDAENPQSSDNQQDEVSETPAERDLRLLQKVQEQLKALPAGHEDIPVKMLVVAGFMADYHVSGAHEGEGLLIEGLEIASKAEGLAGSDSFTRGSAMVTQMTVCITLYKTTNLTEWLHKSIQLGTEAIKFLEDHRDQTEAPTYGFYYSFRCERVADAYELLFRAEKGPEEKKREWIGEALAYQRNAVASTIPAHYVQDGEQKLLLRYKRWTDLWVCMVEQNEQPNYEHLLEHMSTELQFPSLEGDADGPWAGDPVELYPFKIRLGILCRQWSHTKKPDDFNLVHQYLLAILRTASQSCCSASCPLHNLGDELWGFDVNKPHHITRRAAEWFDYWYSVDSQWAKESIDWSEHLPSVNTSLALWEETTRHITRETWMDMLEDDKPCAAIRDRLETKYYFTRSASDGWLLDDRNDESSRIGCLNQTAHFLNWKPEDKLVDILENIQNTSVGWSGPSGRRCIMHPTPMCITQKPYSLDNVRLKFALDDDDKEKIENWISRRTTNGQYVLGGAVRGRDDDIFAHIENRSKPKEDSKQANDDKVMTDVEDNAINNTGADEKHQA